MIDTPTVFNAAELIASNENCISLPDGGCAGGLRAGKDLCMHDPEHRLRFYLCGPMSGYPQFNIPRFDDYARQMRHRGYHVVSPAELDDPEYRAACLRSDGQTFPLGQTWGSLLARDVQLIGDQIDAMVLLPMWHRSRGARLEVFVGLLKPDLCFYEWNTFAETLIPLAREEIRTVMRINIP